MSRRTAAWLAWSLCAVCVVLIALGLLLDFLTDELLSPDVPAEILAGPALAVLAAVRSLAYLTVGALIASRLPANPIGWIFCGVGLLFETRRLSTAYANYALLENPAFPGGEYVAWFSTWVGDVGLALVGVLLMLLFPEGRLLSRRWRIVVWAALCGSVLLALVSAFSPGPLRGTLYYVDNPFPVVG
jgi:two-component system, NarL family, sensor kinase